MVIVGMGEKAEERDLKAEKAKMEMIEEGREEQEEKEGNRMKQ